MRSVLLQGAIAGETVKEVMKGEPKKSGFSLNSVWILNS